MKAEVEPLNGKYYGTRVKFDNGELIQIWVSIGDYSPSEREYDFVGADGKYYVFSGYEEDWGNEGTEEEFGIDAEGPCIYEYEICDSHYETALSYRIAQGIVEMVKEW